MKLIEINRIAINIAAICLLAVTAACSTGELETEMTEITFRTSFQENSLSKAFGEEMNADRLIVGVFVKGSLTHANIPDSWQFHEIGREEFDINGTGSDIEVTLSLAKERCYSFVFWAQNKECRLYGIKDLTSIVMYDTEEARRYPEVEKMDTFYATVEDVEIDDGSITYPDRIILKRPVGMVRIGSSGSAVAARVTVTDAYDTFHPFAGKVSGKATFVWKFDETTQEEFEVSGKKYRYLAMGYLFAPSASPSELNCGMTYMEKGETKEWLFNTANIQANYRTNIAGPFTE